MNEPMQQVQQAQSTSSAVVLVFAWLAIGLPLLWGVAQTLLKAVQLFK
jgi:hypothetical protein